jgi:glycosyltransferase involved in cell wall biosynthesis
MRLFFFTAQYPYGNVSETFIENEICFLAEAFDEIIIIPSEKESEFIRSLPNNVEVSNLFIDNELSNYKRVFFRNILSVFILFFSELMKQNNFRWYFKNIKFYLDFITRQYHKYLLLKKYLKIKKVTDTDVFYDFWYVNTAPALALLRKQKIINKLVVRAHRYDLYNSEWVEGKVPYRNIVYKYADKSVFSNRHGKQYFMETLNLKNDDKTSVHYLGVPLQTYSYDIQKENKGFTIVSCSGINERKGVLKIPKILSAIKEEIYWYHFGDGVQKSKLETLCEKLPPNIHCNLMGHVNNIQVIEFYKNHKIDLFMSFTKSEGLPVSFKEAQSFGIPIFSTDVCGIPDIVNEKTGVLIKLEESEENIITKLETVINKYPFDRNEIITFFSNHFLADKVYPKFINEILIGNETNKKS